MKDNEFIKAVKKKISTAISLTHSNEISIVAEYLKDVVIPHADSTHIWEPYYTNDMRSLYLWGYKDAPSYHRSKDNYFQIDMSALDKKTKKAVEVLIHDSQMYDIYNTLLNNLNQQEIKRVNPYLKMFVNLVEEDYKRAKEERHELWRKTYDRIVELFGDVALG